MNILRIIVTLILCCVYTTESARILGVFPFATYSHYALGIRLMKELAKQGHDVTMISPYTQKTAVKNFRDIELSGFAEAMEEIRDTLFEEEQMSFIKSEMNFYDFVTSTSEAFLKKESITRLLKSNEKFDLIILEDFSNYPLYGLCYRFKAPCISFSSIGLSRLSNEQVGNPLSPAYIPDFNLPYGSNMNFLERIYNTFCYSFGVLYKHLHVLPKHNEILQKYFPGAPNINEFHYNVSLVFVNSHVSTNPAVPYVPNMIDIGGFHVEPPKQLPKHLQEYLDNAKEGKREAILKTFSKLKQKVLWKWEDEDLPGKPPNVKIEKWLPQSDVLAHPNVKLFITHGGLLSTIETVYHGVPIVGIPIFGDQKLNLQNAIRSGFGLEMPYTKLTEETFSAILEEALTNPKYSENVKRRSKIMHDQPMKPLDKAIFWVEYVMRHKGAPHLRSAALNLHWYQYFLLDVLLVVIVAAFVVIASLYFGIKCILCRGKSQKVSGTKKKN